MRDALNKALSVNGLGTQGQRRVPRHTYCWTDFRLQRRRKYNQRDTFLIVPIVLLLVGIVLGLLLRSLIAAALLAHAVTLDFLAAIGVVAFLPAYSGAGWF